MVSPNIKARSFPAIYNIGVLNDIRINPSNYPQLGIFIHNADSIAGLRPLSVMDKKKTFAPNRHYYCSISRYAWPNSENPEGPYVIRDGITNPDYSTFDGTRLEALAYRLQYLSVAYYVTRKYGYRKAATEQLRVWFQDKRTKMSPNFEYAQVQPGIGENKGQAYGLAELSHFTKILESIMLVDYVKGIRKNQIKELRDWFKNFQNWLMDSQQWHIVLNSNYNNIITSNYVALAEMFLFTGDIMLSESLSEEFKERVIKSQIEEDGKQPAELKRAIGFGYSVGNLDEVVNFCLVMKKMGKAFYQESQTKIDVAFEYLYQFVNNHEAFPYQQNSSWSYYENKLRKNMKRLTRLPAGETNIQNLASEIELKNSPILDLVY